MESSPQSVTVDVAPLRGGVRPFAMAMDATLRSAFATQLCAAMNGDGTHPVVGATEHQGAAAPAQWTLQKVVRRVCKARAVVWVCVCLRVCACVRILRLHVTVCLCAPVRVPSSVCRLEMGL